MSTVPGGPTAPSDDLSQVYRLMQQVFSLVLSRLKADDPIVLRISEKLYEKISESLSSSLPLTLRRTDNGFTLNTLPLPDSFVLRKLFESSRCTAITFKSGFDINEMREFVREVSHCFQHGVPPFPSEDETRRYTWVTDARTGAGVSTFVGGNLMTA